MSSPKISVSVADGNLVVTSNDGKIPQAFAHFLKENKQQIVHSLSNEISSEKNDNPVEERLKQIWLQLTNVNPSMDSIYLDQCQSSMDIVSLKNRIFKAFQVDISVAELFKNPVFSDQVKLIEAQSDPSQLLKLKEPNDAKKTSSIENKINTLVKQFGILGTNISLFAEGKLSSYSMGFSDPEHNTAMFHEERFRASCLAKVLTTYAALRLVERQLLKLDLPLQIWVDDFPVNVPSLSLRHLLSHSSGFDESMFNDQHRESKSLDEFVNSCSQYGLMFEPGEEYIYSPSNTLIVAWLLEKFTNKSWLTVLEEEVFSPLGIYNCYVAADFDNDAGELENPVLEKLAGSYARSLNGTSFEKAYQTPMRLLYEPAASTRIALNSLDIIKLAVVPLLRGKTIAGAPYLTPSSAKQLVTQHVYVEGHYFINAWALGWLGFPVYGKYGFITGSKGQHTCVAIDSNSRQAVVIQTNTYPNFEFFDAVVTEFQRTSLFKPLDTKPEFALHEVCGKYSANGINASIYEENKQFYVCISYLQENGTWSEDVIGKITDSGMGDYIILPRVYPLTDSISFHDFTGAGHVTHIRITQKLCRKISDE